MTGKIFSLFTLSSVSVFLMNVLAFKCNYFCRYWQIVYSSILICFVEVNINFDIRLSIFYLAQTQFELLVKAYNSIKRNNQNFKMSKDWKHGTCGCTDDMGTCKLY